MFLLLALGRKRVRASLSAFALGFVNDHRDNPQLPGPGIILKRVQKPVVLDAEGVPRGPVYVHELLLEKGIPRTLVFLIYLLLNELLAVVLLRSIFL